MTMPGFSEDDLYANQRGRLTERQRQRLQQQHKLLTHVMRFGATGSAVTAVIGVLVGQVVGSWFTLLMIALAAIEFGVLYPLIDRFRKPFQTDLSEGRVERIDGEATTLAYRKRRVTLTAIKIGEKQVYADRASFRTLSAGGRYRAYFAPASSTLMSFERLESSDLT